MMHEEDRPGEGIVGVEAESKGWSVAVVRGVGPGRRYAIAPGRVVLGRGPQAGLDLSRHEPPNSPRRLAERQAELELIGPNLAIRDLGSPGGTLVNRVRLTGAASRPLAAGDVIQLGPVQLEVISGPEPAGPMVTAPPTSKATTTTASATARPGPIPTSPSPAGGFTLRLVGDAVCRSWDDVLVVSSQRWAALRDDLTSGRLASSLAGAGLGVWSPDAMTTSSPGSATPDDRLDAWLATLPHTRTATPELDVYPSRISARVGTTDVVSITLTNVGHRLLRATTRIEPAGCAWAQAMDTGPVVVLGPTAVRVRLAPDTTGSCHLVVESNGGTSRLEVRAEAVAPAGHELIRSSSVVAGVGIGTGLRSWLEPIPLARRAGVMSLAMALARLSVRAAGGGLAGAVVALGGVGLLIGLALAIRARRPSDALAGAIAGAGLGVGLAAGLDAAIACLEPRLGVDGSWLAAVALWAAIGAGLGAVSRFVAPARPAGAQPTQGGPS